jgi:hypothetical protein
MRAMGRPAALALAAGVVVIGGLFAAQAVIAAPSSNGQTTPTTARARIVHAEGTMTYLDGSTRQFTADAGEVSGTSGEAITLKQADGKTITATVGSAACVRNNGQPATLADLTSGERALVVQENGAVVAVRAGTRPSENAQAAAPTDRPDPKCLLRLGVTHGDLTLRFADGTTKAVQLDRGMVTTVDGGSISILRRDGTTVTATVDDATTVRLDCDPAAIGDVKVGQVAAVFSDAGNAERISAMDGLGRLRELRSGSPST